MTYVPHGLSRKHRIAWSLRMQGQTLKQCGDAVGVSPERARQMIAKTERMACSLGRLP